MADNSKSDLNNIQKKIFNFILEEVESKGYPPSVREISEAVNRSSTSTIHLHLKKLEQYGYIRRDSSKPRAIEIIKDIDSCSVTKQESEFMPNTENTIMVPLVGEIAAGQPIIADERIEDYYPMPMSFMGNFNYFMLKVRGDSMVNAGILEGDLLLIQEQNTANNGQIVAALLDESATVKTFYKEEKMIRLQPENDHMSPIYTDSVRILGIVKAVMRQLS